MRNEQKMMDLILRVAKSDELIRAVSMEGSRANPAVPKDQYQDYDISYYVTDIAPFYNNPAWVEEKFDKPLIMQMPEAMRWPDGGGHFNYMMIYPDGNRLDLTFQPAKHVDNGEPSVVLLDKDNGNGLLPPLPPPSDAVYHIKPPSPLFYYSCCNEFWWCLNNVAKGIARDELPYAMCMLNGIVRPELHYMIEWYIGTLHGFSLSVGKDGKYYKKYLPPELYTQYAATYSGSGYDEIWAAIDVMCGLFHELAPAVAACYGFSYRQEEEDGMREYIRMVRGMFCESVLPAPKPLDQITEEERSRLFPIILSEYNPDWPQWYVEEKENLLRLIGADQIARISHYGSTAVPGLTAKPTVDILLEIKLGADVNQLMAALPYPEYSCMPGSDKADVPPLHLMFVKGYTPAGFADKVYHIHVRYPGDWDELRFRDYLIAHPETAAEYAALKHKLCEKFEYDRDGYTEAKGAFVRTVMEKVRGEISNG